jgi:hypothetical protein
VEEPLFLEAGQMVRITLTPEEIASDDSWLVSSNRPVAVFTGGEGGWGGETWEQLPPVSRWGTETVAIPIEGHSSSDLVLVSDDTTVLELDCGGPRTLLAGQILRVEIAQPTRVVANRPIMAMVESRQTGDTTAPNPGIVALTPEALHRAQVEVEPIELEHNARFHDYGAEITTLVAVSSSTLVGSDPLLSPVQVAAVAPSLVEVLHVDQPSTLEGAPFRGIEFGIAPYGTNDETDLYEKFPWWIDVTYVTHLGYDCTDCVADLDEPVTCP